MAAADRIGVWVCHDNPVLQAGLMATLARHGDFNCSEGDDVALTPPAFGARPDVIVADHGRGLRSLSESAALPPGYRPRVLIVTHSDRECDIRAALSGGVQGYLLLEDAPQQLASAIRALLLGGRVLSAKVASKLAENVSLESLTQREAEVLSLVIEGLCNKLVATRLGITVGTVKSHLRAAFGKLGASSRTQAVAIAQRRGLFESRSGARTH